MEPESLIPNRVVSKNESHERRVVENIVKYAAPHLKIAMMVQYQPSRTDYLNHAQELIAWAQEDNDDGKVIKKITKCIVSAVGHGNIQGHYQGNNRKCFNCGKRGHLSRRCHQPRKDDSRGKDNFVLFACENPEHQRAKKFTPNTFLKSLKDIQIRGWSTVGQADISSKTLNCFMMLWNVMKMMYFCT